MGLGVLSDKHLGDDVPGTTLLDDLHSHGKPEIDVSNVNLKRNKDGIILVPQPSDSPNDPLNWPLWRKAALMLTITYGAGIVGAFGPIINAGLVQIAENLNTTTTELSKITGDLCLSIGLVLLLTAPASVIWGRRPIFLLGNVLLLASSIWSAASKDLGSLTGSRVIGGMGMAPIECLVEATIADIFFVHERGRWIALWSFALLGGICGVSAVNGYLIEDVSWRVCFIIEAALCGALLVLTILFVPETAYVRPTPAFLPTEEIISNVGDTKKESDSGTASPSDKASVSHQERVSTHDAENLSSSEKPKSTLQLMAFWNSRRYSNENFFKIAARPFTLLCSPVVLWGTLIYGTTNGWLVALSVSVSLLFSEPAFGYGYSSGVVGLIAGVGPFFAALLGNLIAGPISDWTVTWMARRNGGIYCMNPSQFRLLIIIPTCIFMTMGWFGWGISAHLVELWIGPEVFYSLINFGQALGNLGMVGYVVDAHSIYAPESFATINCVKNIFVFGLTYFVDPWIVKQGVLKTFCVIGGINVAICLTTIPMYIYGKRARSWVHRTPWMLA